MKNLFKFGFLGLALTFAIAACNQPATQEEETHDVEVITEEDAVIEADTTDTIAVEEEVIEPQEEVN